ncbi:hypothetical protein [Streptomyces sp. NPDC127084]|uniref:hypothetical protein n=1 Tax=Streptomyces sp. NPDC127084 TaxID=3347133 RepID=UPI003668DA84
MARRLAGTAYPASPPRLDVYAALTAVLPDAVGAVPQPPPAGLPPTPSPAPRQRAVLVASAAGGLVLLVAAAVVVFPRGRARGWRPAA